MKLFVDSAKVDEIAAFVPLGIVDGVTTTPSLLGKQGPEPRTVLKQICNLVQGPGSAEVVATDADGMIREGRELSQIDPHIVVKVPFGKAGVEACHTLTSEDIKVNVTLVFSASQAMLAAKVGAPFVSPFVGRLDDIATPGMDLISQIVDIYEGAAFQTEILVASIRGPLHVVEAARLGADVCTCPPKAIDALFNHPLTDIGLQKFLADWAKSQKQSG